MGVLGYHLRPLTCHHQIPRGDGIVPAAPVFGQDQRILLEKGRTVKDSGGIPVREFQLTVEYTTKEEN